MTKTIAVCVCVCAFLAACGGQIGAGVSTGDAAPTSSSEVAPVARPAFVCVVPAGVSVLGVVGSDVPGAECLALGPCTAIVACVDPTQGPFCETNGLCTQTLDEGSKP